MKLIIKLESTGYSTLPSPPRLMRHCGVQSRLVGHTHTHAHTGCAKKVTPFWYLSFLPLLDALFAIFVYLRIIFIKCLISEPSVVSIQMDSPAGWCAVAHCDKLPQKGECFIHRASDVASKQP